MTSKSVFVVTTADDAHANHIVPLLQKRGAVVNRLNGDKFACEPCCMDFYRDGDSPLKYGAADVVWYRRVVLPERFDATSQFIRQETEGLLNSILLEYEGVRWVNNRSSLERAKPKLHQLSTARKFGFRTPRSIVTNQLDALRMFFHEHHDQVVAKPIQTQVIISPTKELVVGTRRLMHEDLQSAVHFFPCFAQERLRFLYEMRVIAFRDQLCSFRLSPTVPADDLKQLKLSQIAHEVCKLDPVTEDKIRKFMRHYSLEFGAFDFGVVDDDEPYFLELNPNGQWLWLQFMTGFDLETLFIDLLLE